MQVKRFALSQLYFSKKTKGSEIEGITTISVVTRPLLGNQPPHKLGDVQGEQISKRKLCKGLIFEHFKHRISFI
jgi:hypothetical protein